MEVSINVSMLMARAKLEHWATDVTCNSFIESVGW